MFWRGDATSRRRGERRRDRPDARARPPSRPGSPPRRAARRRRVRPGGAPPEPVRRRATSRPLGADPIVDEPAVGSPRPRADARRLHVPPARLPRRRTATGPSWDDVEETLIAGDVGRGARDGRRRAGPAAARPEGAEAAVRAELAALLVPREPGWEPRPAGRRRPGGHPRSSA